MKAIPRNKTRRSFADTGMSRHYEEGKVYPKLLVMLLG